MRWRPLPPSNRFFEKKTTHDVRFSTSLSLADFEIGLEFQEKSDNNDNKKKAEIHTIACIFMPILPDIVSRFYFFLFFSGIVIFCHLYGAHFCFVQKKRKKYVHQHVT